MIEYKQLHTLAKSLKRPIIKITPYSIMGSDEDMCTLSIIYLYDDIDSKYNQWTGMVNEFIEDSFSNNIYISNKFDDLFIRLSNTKNTSRLIESVDRLTDDDSFMNIHNMKAKEGAKLYRNNNKVFTNTGTMHPINKGELISMNIYSTIYNTYLVEYIINKKGGYIINEYIHYLSLV